MLRTNSDAEHREFDPATRSLHWLTAGLMLLVFVLAFSIDRTRSGTSFTVLLQLHRSIGITVWIVTLVRLVWRQFARFPDWPADMPQPMRLAAQGSELALYALLLAQPALGLLQTNAQGDRVDLFFLGQLPPLIGENRQLARQLLAVHETVGFLLLGLIALHVSAAVFHHFWRCDDTLTAMLPSAGQLIRRGARPRSGKPAVTSRSSGEDQEGHWSIGNGLKQRDGFAGYVRDIGGSRTTGAFARQAMGRSGRRFRSRSAHRQTGQAGQKIKLSAGK